jgi:hypothetical protein
MSQTNRTPAGKAGASRDQLSRCSHSFNGVGSLRTQSLILAISVRPEMAAMLAALACGGAA